jgi:AcrR family transcriptional regulator
VLLAEVGYDRLTMDAVAARARAGKTTIYRRWPGKAELVVDALNSLKGVPEVPDTGSLRQDLRALAESITSAEGQFGAQVTVGMVNALAHIRYDIVAERSRSGSAGVVRRASMIRARGAGEVSKTRGRGGRSLDSSRDLALREAALVLLAEVGYDRLTMDAVAARARAGKTTIYRRWPGKAELVVDALNSLKGVPEVPDTGSLRQDLRALAESITSAEGRFGARLTVGMVNALAHDGELRRVFGDKFIAPRMAGFRTVFERAVARGEMRAAVPLALGRFRPLQRRHKVGAAHPHIDPRHPGGCHGSGREQALQRRVRGRPPASQSHDDADLGDHHRRHKDPPPAFVGA